MIVPIKWEKAQNKYSINGSYFCVYSCYACYLLCTGGKSCHECVQSKLPEWDPHLCNKGSLSISTHSLLVAWHSSAILSQQEPVEAAKEKRGLLMHLLSPWENLKFCLWVERKGKVVHEISGSMRRRTCLFGQHFLSNAWHVGSNINTYGMLGKGI